MLSIMIFTYEIVNYITNAYIGTETGPRLKARLVRLFSAENDAIRAAAAREGVSIEAFTRSALLRAALRVLPKPKKATRRTRAGRARRVAAGRAVSALILSVALAVPLGAQVVYDSAPALVWFTSTACPASWAALTPTETRPALPDTYRVRRPGGGPAMLWSRAAVESAFSVNGALDTQALDAALASGAVVSLQPGRPPQIRCSWRPIGGSP